MKVLLLVAVFTISSVLSESDSAVVSSSSTGDGSTYEYAYNVNDPTTGSVHNVQHKSVAGADVHEAVPVVNSPVDVPHQPKQAFLTPFEPQNQKLVYAPFYDILARGAVPSPADAHEAVPVVYSPVDVPHQPKQGGITWVPIVNPEWKPLNQKSVYTPIYPELQPKQAFLTPFEPQNQKLIYTPIYDIYARGAVPSPVPAAPYVPYPYSGYPYAYAAPAYNPEYYGYAKPEYVKVIAA